MVAVDDGSTDASRKILEQWQQRRPDLVRVLHQPNDGQASARNAGLSVARGTWVTFTDPDDMLDDRFLSSIDRFVEANPDVAMMATSRLLLDDRTGETTDNHPLRKHFGARDRLVTLRKSPTHFYGSAPCAFFRRDLLVESDLQFPEDIRPNFEDGYFCRCYLLRLPEPAIGFVGSARYIHRKRADASSSLQRSLSDPGRYTTVLRNGYLRVLRLALELRGELPPWLQNHIIYELSYYFSSQDHIAGSISAASGAVATEYHALLGEICGLLDADIIRSFNVRKLKPTWRDILLHSYRDSAWIQPYLVVSRVDARQRLVQVRYRFTGQLPLEAFEGNGVAVSPAYAKTRTVSYHDRVLLRERILWFESNSSLRCRLNDSPVEVVFREPVPPVYTVEPRALSTGVSAKQETPSWKRSRRLSVADRTILRLADSAPAKRLFENAWVLMDRIHDADDSAEILFRYLRTRRRKINAWFVVERGTADWSRLKSAGYRRVIAHGSVAWKILMLNAEHLISSHADGAVVTPPEVTRLGERKWRFTFLQHGVIKDDLSTWLNPKPIDVFVVSTPGEFESIAGDDSAYVYGRREVQLTGLPRFANCGRPDRGVTQTSGTLSCSPRHGATGSFPLWRRDRNGARRRQSCSNPSSRVSG